MDEGDESSRERAVALLRREPKRSGIFVDYDGTLAPVVVDPQKARPLLGAVDVLDRLAGRFGVVAVISGRPIEFLQRHLPVTAEVRLCGLYGLQRVRGSHQCELKESAYWRDVVDNGATRAQGELPKEVLVERKGLSFALHFRAAPQYATLVEDWAVRFASSSGLDARSGRLSVELGPFHDIDKGTTVASMAEGLRAACVMGDDQGDLPAFLALDQLADSSQLEPVKIAVSSPEMPSGLKVAADFIVEGPQSALSLLNDLAG